jgi:uncharacterized protein YwgA
MDYFDGVAAKLVQLAPAQQLVGKVRLQKVAYLLNELGLQTGLKFSYYHYGPYSRDLEQGIDEARSFRWLEEKQQHRAGDGATYTIYELGEKSDEAPPFDLLGMDELKARELINRFSGVTSTVLELAATAHWLVAYEKVADWETEIKLRKGVKTESGRLDRAIDLLREVGLRPGLAVAA